MTNPPDLGLTLPLEFQLTALLEVADVVLQLGQVERVTAARDGRLESDTTHTLMLALSVATLAPSLAPEMDRGLLVMFALVHDLVEAEAGDTNTARELSPRERRDKAQREREGLVALRRRLFWSPWMVELIERYERQLDPEARLVRVLDKCMPRLTHLLNEGCALRVMGFTTTELRSRQRAQLTELESLYPELRGALDLLRLCSEAVEQRVELGQGGSGG